MAQLNDLVDMLNVCRLKLSFLTDIFSQDELQEFRFSSEGFSGFYFILRDIKNEIEFIGNELSERIKENKVQKKTGTKDYSDEWKKSLYYDEKIGIYQPAVHIESTMIKSAVNFQIIGKGKKTYKDLFKSAVFVVPEMIPHNKKEPDYIHKCLARIKGDGIERLRPALKDWVLEFNIQSLDEQISKSVVYEVLTHAGRFVGVGDFRPRYGRFVIEKFE